MPFTLFHVAAVLPLLRHHKTRLSATGLIISSIAPDFEKFLRLGLHNGHSHTLASILYFSCPVSLGLAFLFHGVVRDPLIAHLPRFLRQRLARFQDADWGRYFRRHYVVVLLSIIIGAATHLIWDSFTHRRGQLVPYFPWLKAHLHIGPFSPAVFVVLAVFTSTFGAALLLRFVWRLPQLVVAAVPAGTIGRYWLLASGTALTLLLLRLLLADFALDNFEIVVTALSAAMAGVVVASGVAMRRPRAGLRNVA
ncbi:DUF4184 family protein [Hymenobacter siberiensis]|uniref:DUF4184 family protein n=1 Tax=Hymenobacter siberiensis TaxID=2848396 RepID=UPI001C1E17C2|nr:DUF4184 family protein [Hymenobacter siberiensis]